MAKFVINKDIPGAGVNLTIESDDFRQDGEYFIFRANGLVIDMIHAPLIRRIVREQ